MQTVNQAAPSGWLCFIAGAPTIQFKIKNNFTGTFGGKITSAQIYQGSCGTLTLIAADSITINNDTLLTLNLNGLTIGSTLYINTQKGFFPGQCNSPDVCNDNASFDIGISTPLGGDCIVQANYKSLGFCDPSSVSDNIRTCINTGLVNPNPPCDFLQPFQRPLCYSPSTNTLCISFAVPVFGGTSYLPNFTMEVFTSGIPATSLITSPTTLYTFPFFANSTNSLNPAVTYTINVYPPNQYGIAPPCNVIIIAVVPAPDPDFTLSNTCAGNICFNPLTNSGNHTWNILGFPSSNLVSPCYSLAPGTYTVTHKINYSPPGNPGVFCPVCIQKTITIAPPFNVVPVAVPGDVCAGQQVILIDNTLAAISNTVNTTYTVIGTDINGCTATGTVNVFTYTVAPTFTASLTQPFSCIPSGSTTASNTLNLLPLGNYTLVSPGFPLNINTAFTNSVILTPSVNTNYTVLGYSNAGCLTSSIVAVKLVPCACIAATGATMGGIVTNQFNNVGNIKLKAVSDITLTSFPSFTCDPYYGFIGNEIIVYPGVKITLAAVAGGTVYFDGCYVHGCGEMWEGFVMPYTTTKLRVGSNGNKTTLIEDAKVAINFLNQPPALVQPCYLPDIYLDVNNVTFNKNVTAIKISNYQGNTLNYPYKIQNSLFTSRSISITPNPSPTPINNVPSWPSTNLVKNSASGNNTSVQTPYINNVLFPPTAITSTLYNYFGYPSSGIELYDVGLTVQGGNYQFNGIKIGQNGVPNFNCFDNLQLDIYASNTNLTIINSVFQNGRRYGPSNVLGGKGILANSLYNVQANVYNRNQIQIVAGAGNGNFGCRFYEKTACADINDYFDVQISDAKAYSFANNYAQFLTANTFGNLGFNIKTNHYLNIVLQDNQLYNIKSAMLIGTTNANIIGNISLREIGQIAVLRNTVDRYPTLNWPNTVANPYVNIGLSIADPFASPPTLPIPVGAVGALVANNNFNKVHNGVSVLNLAVSPVGIDNNTVTMVNAPPFFPLAPSQNGVLTAQCFKQASITKNNISGPVVWGDSLKGISTAYNHSLSVRCNTAANTARGIEFNGTQTTDFFEDNWMVANTNAFNPANGLVLDNYGVISGSNNIGSYNRPTNNLWVGNWNTPNYKTATLNNSSAKYSKLFVQYILYPSMDPNNFGFTDGNNNLDRYFHLPNNSNNTLLNSAFTIPGCRIGAGGAGGAGLVGARLLLEQAVTNAFNFINNINQAQQINNTNAYRAIKANPALLMGSPILTTFNTAAQSNNLQGMVSIEENLANNNLNTAQSQIAALSPSNAIETNYKDFYTIVNKTKNNTYTATDSTTLFNLANMCPYVDGAVVFQARALYNITYNGYYTFYDNCSPNLQGRSSTNIDTKSEQNEVNVILKSTIFPNPNDGNYALRFSNEVEKQSIEITIFDITGKEILKESKYLQEGNQLKISNGLLNGTYLLKVKLEDGTVDVHRLIINK
jgi:hypothetical protein